MGVTKFVSSAKLVEYLEQEILDALNTRGLYDISRYGWLDDDVPDPDYRGIAIWQAGDAALSDPGVMARLRELGDGFVSCMRSSLHSLGLAILFAGACRDGMSIFSEEAVRFHCRDTVMKLGLAALGLRDFFVVLNGLDSEHGGRMDSVVYMDSVTYHAPFAAALAGRGEDASLAALYDRIERFAAEIAAKCHVCERLSRELGSGTGLPMIACAGNDEEGPDEAFVETTEAILQDLCDWHELMIAAGNNVFMLFAAMADRHTPGAGKAAARSRC